MVGTQLPYFASPLGLEYVGRQDMLSRTLEEEKGAILKCTWLLILIELLFSSFEKGLWKSRGSGRY